MAIWAAKTPKRCVMGKPMTHAFFRTAAAAALIAAAIPASAAAQELRTSSALSAGERQDRIEEMERQLQAATEENDRLQHQLSQAQAEIRRLQGMVGDLSAVRDARDEIESQGQQSGGQQGGGAGARDQRSQTTTPQQQAQSRAQGELGTLSAREVAAVQTEDPAATYQRAREFLVNGQIRQSEAAFADFLERHGDDPNAAEARYWHSFTLLARDAHGEAASGFVEYLRRYPRGQRAPDALVRLGVALKGLGRNEQACQAFRDLPTRYPNASQTLRTMATNESRALNCSRA